MTSSTSKTHFVEVSIITVSRNDYSGFQETLESVVSQNFSNWEMLSIIHSDSQSSVKFAEKASKSDSRVKVIEDKGDGIYQAMNLGLEYATGKYVVFMNSGDEFFDSNSLDSLHTAVSEYESVLAVGQFLVKGVRNRARKIQTGSVNKGVFAFNRTWGCHQAMIFKFIKEMKFDTRYELASDFDFVLRYFDLGTVHRLDNLVAKISPGGKADSNLQKVFFEKFLVRRSRLKGPIYLFFNLNWTLMALSKMYVKRFFG